MTTSLLLASLTAHAQTHGTYTVHYSGGTIAVVNAAANPFMPQTSEYDGGAGAWCSTDSWGNPASFSVTIPDPSIKPPQPLTATFTWTPAPGNPNEPPPAAAVVSQTCTASWTTDYWDGSATFSGSVSNGLGGPVVSRSNGATSTSTLYTVWAAPDPSHPAASFSVTCSPTASFTASSGSMSHSSVSGGVGVIYMAAAVPVTINLSGATLDANGNDNILVGQLCTSSLSGIPSGFTVSNYVWSVTGTTFQYWSDTTPANQTDPYNPNASVYVDGPGRSDQPTAQWYWNDLDATGPTPEMVTCTATVTPPAGQGAAFTVVGTKTVTVLRPNWTANGTAGNMQVSTADPGNGFYGTDYWLWAGPTAGTSVGAGMNFFATVSSPNTALFGNGSLILVQIIAPQSTTTIEEEPGVSVTFPWSQNGEEGLDAVYPYSWTSTTTTAGVPIYISHDSPGMDLNYPNLQSATICDQFYDYLMYFAPGSTQCVPLARLIWSIDGSATLPSTGNWVNFPVGSAGSITPSSPQTSFLPFNEFPMWGQVLIATDGSF